MDAIVSQCQERIERAVRRFLYHAAVEGLDAAKLNGTLSITVEDGQVTGTGFTPLAESVTPKKRGKKSDAMGDPDEQPFAHG